MKHLLYFLLLFLGAKSLFAVATPKKFTSTQTKAAPKSDTTKSASASIPTFNGKKFYLKYSAGTEQMWLNEYLPSGQDFKTYTDMIAVRSYDGTKATPQQVAQIIAGNYAKKYPGIKYMLATNEKTGDGLVSFIVIEGNILEHDLFRTTMHNGTPVSLQYVYREYIPQEKRTREDLISFSKKVRRLLPEWTNALDNMPVPRVVRTVKQ